MESVAQFSPEAGSVAFIPTLVEKEGKSSWDSWNAGKGFFLTEAHSADLQSAMDCRIECQICQKSDWSEMTWHANRSETGFLKVLQGRIEIRTGTLKNKAFGPGLPNGNIVRMNCVLPDYLGPFWGWQIRFPEDTILLKVWTDEATRP